jgi:hypothetical protein
MKSSQAFCVSSGLSMSRRVSCTNACTNQPPGPLVRVGQHDRPIWHTAAREHLFRRSGHIVPDRPLRSVPWADIPQLSTRDQRCPAAWQQDWQQSQPNGTDPRSSANECRTYLLFGVNRASVMRCHPRRRLPLVVAVAVTVAVSRVPGNGPHLAGDGPLPVRAGSGQAPAWPLVSDRSVRRGSGVKRAFACTFTRHFSPVLVALRSQSRLMLEGRARTLSGPSTDLSPARTYAREASSRNVPGTLRA